MNVRLRAKERRERGRDPRRVLVRVVAPHFVAGLTFDADTERCIEAAPILAASIGKTMMQIIAYAHKRGWQIDRVTP